MIPEQIAWVGDSFPKISPALVDAGRVFYARLFAVNPELRALFHGDMEGQSRALMAMVELIVKTLGLHDKLVPLIHYLGERHAVLGVKPQHYRAFWETLVGTLSTTLQDEFTPEVRRAWEAAYEFMEENMK